MIDLTNTRTMVVGGSSGIGFEIAQRVVRLGGHVHLAARGEEKLRAAQARLAHPELSHMHSVDMQDDAAVAALFDELDDVALDHLVITASSAVHGPFAEVPVSDVIAMFASKFFGPYRLAKAALPTLADGASVTFFSGVLSRRPGMNTSGLGAVNAAIEGLTRGLALELGPKVRVNCCSPGMARTEAYAHLSEEAREEMYRATGESLPLGRVGLPGEIADTVLMMMASTFMTGRVVDVDGGHMVRQYATR
ncbi:MAG: SDR family oxidoreductase [Pseudomonadota bacterium]